MVAFGSLERGAVRPITKLREGGLERALREEGAQEGPRCSLRQPGGI